jgi:hypothetical protein
MTLMDLEGDISLERSHTWRWVSIIAVFIPVAAVVLLTAWFIRAFVIPPTVSIPSPATFAAAAPPPPPSIPKRAQVEAPPPPMMAREPAAPTVVASADEPAVSASDLPMFATLTLAPPSFPAAPPAAAAPEPEVSSPPLAAPPVVTSETENASDTPSIMASNAGELESSEPIAGPIPLPRPKRHVAAMSSVVPLPRPKPAEAMPEPDLPLVDRHSIN